MLADKDRIFTNLYGFQSPGLEAAKKRGQWDNTKAILELGPEAVGGWLKPGDTIELEIDRLGTLTNRIV